MVLLREIQMNGMGTTVVAGLIIESLLFYTHVGDSRLYRLRAGRLDLLTEDHTLLQEMKSDVTNKDIDVEATIPGNIVTRALGAEADVEPDAAYVSLEVGDIYLSCSDGLNDRLSDEIIQQTMESSKTLAPIVAYLIMLANEAGGEDNISVVLMGVESSSLLDRVKQYFI